MNLAGVRLSATDLSAVLDILMATIAAKGRDHVCVRDAHGIVKCRKDLVLRAIHNRAMMVAPDGVLLERFPDTRIAGSYSPPFRSLTPDERLEVVARIDATQADIVRVGLGKLRQEVWMAEMRDSLTAPVLIGVGTAFDFHAGVVRQAPKVIQRSGLEWLFRLARELWRRCAVTLPTFIGLVVAQASGLRPFPINPDPVAWSSAPAVSADPAGTPRHGRRP